MKRYLSKRKGIVIFAVILMLITTIPYVIGYSKEGSDWRFTGFVIGVEDGNSYLAKMLSGSEGNWLFRSPHSAEEQDGVVAYLPYLLLGKLASGESRHQQLVALYHSARIIFGILSILATYDFIKIFITKKDQRWRALILVILGGGLGWVLVAISQKGFLGSLPLEFISPESFGFLGIFGFPHLAAARALLLWGLVLFIKQEQGYLAGALWLAAGIFQPMVAAVAWAVIGVYFMTILIVNKVENGKIFDVEPGLVRRMFFRSIQSVLVSAPIVLYTALIFVIDPYFKAWTAQNRFPSPHIAHYIIAYGLVLPLAISGILKILKKGRIEGLLLAGWVVILPVLVYAPVITQRRLAEGIWAVLVIGLFCNYTENEKLPFSANIISLLLLPSTIFIFIGSILQTLNPAEPVFRKANEVAAYEFLSVNSPQDAVVLSSFVTGNNLPAWAPVRVVIGHGPETIGLKSLMVEINDYFGEKVAEKDCKVFFGKYQTEYLFWGPEEISMWDYEPGLSDCLSLIFDRQGYTIYEVTY